MLQPSKIAEKCLHWALGKYILQQALCSQLLSFLLDPSSRPASGTLHAVSNTAVSEFTPNNRRRLPPKDSGWYGRKCEHIACYVNRVT
jgi:hypothetical protein